VWAIGNMLYRIGALMEIEDQVAWVREAGFRGIGFHAHAGAPGHWKGIDPLQTDSGDRARWRSALAGFDWREVHAPFSTEIAVRNLESALPALTNVLQFGHDVGASVVTVHAHMPDPLSRADAGAIEAAMRDLNRKAVACGLVIGLEVVDGFDTISEWSLSNVGVTLDVGHWAVWRRAGGVREPGAMGAAIRGMGKKLVHLHMHDVVGDLDHMEIGTGEVDFEDLLHALRDIAFAGGLCLEMNPDRVSPDGIRRSLAALQSRILDMQSP